MTILKILTYALVSTWSSVSSGYEHVSQLLQPWVKIAIMIVTWQSKGHNGDGDHVDDSDGDEDGECDHDEDDDHDGDMI